MDLNNNTLPVGSIVAFAGNSTQRLEASGWMACDGRTLPAAEYPELFASLLFTYGGAGTAFNIPDYTGQSLQSKGSSTSSIYIIRYTGMQVQIP